MPFLFKRLLLTGGAVLLSTAVVASNHYPPQAKSNLTTVTVNIVWLPSFRAVTAFCEYLDHQSHDRGQILGCFDPRTNTIYAVEPANFNDTLRLEVLGHEFWHALGAMHP